MTTSKISNAENFWWIFTAQIFTTKKTTAGYRNNWLTLINLRILMKTKMLFKIKTFLIWNELDLPVLTHNLPNKTKLTSSFDPNKPVQTGFVPRSQNRRICTSKLFRIPVHAVNCYYIIAKKPKINYAVSNTINGFYLKTPHKITHWA